MRKTKKPEDRTVWEKRVNEYKASGQSQAAWCKEKGINPNTFNYWYLKFKTTATQKKKPVKWLALDTKAIEIKPKPGIEPACAIDVKIAWVTIEVKPGFDPAHLLNIVKTLSKLC